MRLTFEFLGWTLDWSLVPTSTDDVTEFEPYQDAGTTTTTVISGEHNGWEKPSNLWDEASEGDEDKRRLGFGG